MPRLSARARRRRRNRDEAVVPDESLLFEAAHPDRSPNHNVLSMKPSSSPTCSGRFRVCSSYVDKRIMRRKATLKQKLAWRLLGIASF